ncbi:cbb3-type cytochrome c oxidase subunit I [Salinicola sp. LHM]|uniref:cbb3-type cytochrome c oxidase subunit I n=1 Tax=unclassified Salinicola TaxID=2634022 RepID=UPI0008DD48F3|nr:MULTISPECIES: cbb3-type cytochrome c oxidase subunit I [unclassified Salinicola]OHZ04932.1 cytochrome o ubiquinol oxidase subunit I [Salinicola sp. MIT1003]WQH32281.1 cbb3-type cytochrome c oxidase subunit I [Salinicola sp. LHM]
MSDIWNFVFGRLGWDALPFWEAVRDPTTFNIINGIIAGGAAGMVVLGVLGAVILVTWLGKWKYLWSEWLTSPDHKKIGIMFIVIAMVMLSRAIIEAAFMRAQQAVGLDGGFLSPEHFGEFFTTHGTIMIFFMAMPFLTGIINYVMPLQIGARDLSFPVMNQISLGLTAAGAAIVMISLVLAPFSTGGWSGYPPYTELSYSPDAGVDYWIWAVTLSTLSSTLTGINFAVTIYKKRAPGMKLFRMPLFTWTALSTAILMIFGMPPLTVATALLALDRYLDFHMFTSDLGGNMMNYINLFWAFGHPEVYILILTPFGIYSEVFSTFSGKRLYGYTLLVIATICIAFLSFTVWLHHFFTMGQSAAINAVFGIATMLIGIPTGVKVYDWMLTMYRGRVRLSAPMIYAVGFIMLFVIGGLTGIILATPSVDYQVHNSLFLIAHFHNMLIPGTLFGMLAATNFWFPKAFGFRLEKRWGRRAAYCWVIGFMLAFFPLYALGVLGMPRRSLTFFEPAYLPWTIAAGCGAIVILFAMLFLLIQLWVSVRDRHHNNVFVGDPWDGRSLEWATSSPPPEYNFPVIPEVFSRDAFMAEKEQGKAYQIPDEFPDIEMPANSAMGVIIAVTGTAMAFGLTWYMWWLVILAAMVTLVAIIARGYVRKTTRTIPGDEVRRTHLAWIECVRRTTPVDRSKEQTRENRGLPVPPVEGAVQ